MDQEGSGFSGTSFDKTMRELSAAYLQDRAHRVADEPEEIMLSPGEAPGRRKTGCGGVT